MLLAQHVSILIGAKRCRETDVTTSWVRTTRVFTRIDFTNAAIRIYVY
jgi:hypothetical protein